MSGKGAHQHPIVDSPTQNDGRKQDHSHELPHEHQHEHPHEHQHEHPHEHHLHFPPHDHLITTKSQTLTGVIDVLGGTIAGILGVVAGQPLDTLKVRLQAMSYVSTLDCLRKTVTGEGILALYKGLVPPLVGAGLVNAVIFFAYGQLNYIQQKHRQKKSPKNYSPVPTLKEVMVSGLGTGFLQSVVVTPVEGIKCRLQGQKKKDNYKGTIDCTMKVYKSAGIRGIWHGWAVTTMRDTPTFGVYFLVYEFCKRRLFKTEDQDETSELGMFISGGIAGVLGWLVSYPMDVIKSRMQTDSLTKPRYKGSWDCAQKSYKESGWRVFFKGLPATLTRGFIVNGATLLGYEFTLKLLHSYYQ